MNWFILSLITAFFWGIGQIFLKKGLQSISPLWNLILEVLIYIPLLIPLSLSQGVNFSFNFYFIFLMILMTTLYGFYYYAISKGHIALSGTLVACYPAITLLLSIFFLQESLSIFQLVMICLILTGIILLSFMKQSTDKKRKVYKTLLLWGIFGAITVGLGDFLAKVIIGEIGPSTFNFLFPFTYGVTALLFRRIDTKGRVLPKKMSFSLLSTSLIGLIMLALGQLSFNFALSTGPLSLVSIITSSYVALTAVLSLFFFREKLLNQQLIGILLIIIGIIFIGL